MATKDQELGQSVVTAIKEFVRSSLVKRDERLDELEERLGDIAAQAKDFRYVGTWEGGRKYMRGNFCTDGGSVWHCNRETNTRPGPGDAWTLAVKSGRDGRDLR